MPEHHDAKLSSRSQVYLGLVLAVFVCAPAGAELKIAPLKFPVESRTPGVWVPFASSHPPSARRDETVTRILISVHSSGYDALQYYENARIAASKVPGASRQTLIIAPQFFHKNAVPGQIPKGLLYWTVPPYRGSSRGAIGPEENKLSISAFEILDDMLSQLSDKKVFPRLKDLVLVGHSAGGQLVQRYALVGKFGPPQGINCRFVVCAPSSFAYPTPERRVPGSNGRFAKPSREAIASNPSFHNWGYGLAKPYGYFKGFNPKATIKRYGRRNVYYLCGERDTNGNDGTTSTNGAAMMQGSNRRDRTETFYEYLLHTYGKGIAERHKMAITPGVGHYGRGNMTSKAGLRFLFADKP
ncbi:MAG: hypothetical protein CMJ48_14040 [Planctomycetaceae bacterium]|nr:hypothetical protein [Planctomycetaceae bacterium]